MRIGTETQEAQNKVQEAREYGVAEVSATPFAISLSAEPLNRIEWRVIRARHNYAADRAAILCAVELGTS
jgi:hypothetical protein